ncbi:ABC transporter permease [Virgibacillus sp. NKC19-16]|uniref:ABC transporter permease n=1 Tax=Virgibacillus salidurans TaxID=2831673 RepID=UPI001F2A8E58|nr:ABC transporter permease [Virgibacillus sp. NKC19-16]UJL45018.1 ABC transporter permease [Virgibacillus sp. NKC19-16]
MTSIFQTRLLHWKKQWTALLFWLLLPIIATNVIIHATDVVQGESKIPVGIVIEEETPLAMALLQSMKETPLLRIYETTEENGLLLLERHELDSVFVIEEEYAEQVRSGSRNQLITGYQSDLSFAYTPVREMIISYVQQDTARTKAANTVDDLSERYNPNQQWTWEDIIEKSKQIETDENLLRTTFSFSVGDENAENDEHDVTVWTTWGLWAVFSVLSTLLLFDWVIKEGRSSLISRFAFIRIPFKDYLLQNVLLYTVLLFLMDLTAALVFYFLHDEQISLSFIGALLIYRFTLNTGTFLLALVFKNLYLYYSVSFAITLIIAITSGAVIPVDGITNYFEWLEFMNPLEPFLSGNSVNVWLFLFLIVILIWYLRREKSNA